MTTDIIILFDGLTANIKRQQRACTGSFSIPMDSYTQEDKNPRINIDA
jgi:hypothetical protein